LRPRSAMVRVSCTRLANSTRVGPPVGLFLQIVEDDARDAGIRGQPYTFSILKQAQALGDLESLRSRGLPVLRLNLGSRLEASWKALLEAIETAVR